MKFPISDAALAQHMAILGKTGSGKTTVAKGAVEHLVAQGARVCILDPIKSDWWGLTSSADGKKPGLPFQILGGPRGHVPLHPSSGKVIADLVAAGTLPLSILDMADFPPGGLAQFFNDFAPTLLRKIKGVVHLVMEEAHEFAPKERAGIGNENMLIHHAKKLATAGRSRGIRLVLATQRIQALHNALLGSCDTMVALRLTAPADQKPVVDWLKANLDKDKAAEVSASMAKLKVGTGWICSSDDETVLAQFPRIKTYDNSATPEAGARDAGEVRTAAVDVDKLRAIIGEAAADAAANDPVALRKQVAELKAKIANPPQQTSQPVAKNNTADQKVHERALAAAREEGAQAVRKTIPALLNAQHSSSFKGGIKAGLEYLITRARNIAADPAVLVPIPDRTVIAAIERTMRAKIDVALPPQTQPRSTEFPKSPPQVKQITDAAPLGAERKPLAALAAVSPAGMTEPQWAVAAGIKRSGGTWAAYKSRLRSAGRIEDRGGLFFVTEQGMADLGGEVPSLPAPGPELVEFWAGKISGVGPMLRALAGAHPDELTRDELADQLNLAAGGGTFSAYLSRLKSPGLIEVSKTGVRASDSLMGAA